MLNVLIKSSNVLLHSIIITYMAMTLRHTNFTITRIQLFWNYNTKGHVWRLQPLSDKNDSKCVIYSNSVEPAAASQAFAVAHGAAEHHPTRWLTICVHRSVWMLVCALEFGWPWFPSPTAPGPLGRGPGTVFSRMVLQQKPHYGRMERTRCGLVTTSRLCMWFIGIFSVSAISKLAWPVYRIKLQTVRNYQKKKKEQRAIPGLCTAVLKYSTILQRQNQLHIYVLYMYELL